MESKYYPKDRDCDQTEDRTPLAPPPPYNDCRPLDGLSPCSLPDQYPPAQPVIDQQPRPSAQYQVIQQSVSSASPRTWNSGICSCCDDISSCCLVTFFAPCFACYLADRMGECFCIAMPCVSGGIMALRTRLRTQENIQGSICQDYAASVCCMHCVLCQMSREVDFTQNRDALRRVQTNYYSGYGY